MDCSIYWRSFDGQTSIYKCEHPDTRITYTLMHKGREVFPSTESFDKISRYVWNEFSNQDLKMVAPAGEEE